MSPNVILIDAAYIDRVAAELRRHFSAELQRTLPKADLAQWLICTALDAEIVAEGRAAEGDDAVQCVFLHDKEVKVLDNFAPGNFALNIDGKAFAEPGVGEFVMACCPIERVTTLEDLCAESLEALLDDKNVKRLAVIADLEGSTPESRSLTKRIVKLCAKHREAEADATTPAPATDVTLFVMRPVEGDGFAQQILGFSLLSALGISSDEL